MRLVLQELVQTPAITVAAIFGACLGGAAEIAAACDLVIVAEEARVGFPEIRLACFPPAAVVLLPLRVGEARAGEWILTGTVFSGRQAAAAGFACRAVPAAQLAGEVDRQVKELLTRSPRALGAARDLLRRGRREALERDLPPAEEAYRGLAGSEDLARAVRDFKKSRS
jgi:cyclohexa-1,5-dienecarbonyl-CoA hydratase